LDFLCAGEKYTSDAVVGATDTRAPKFGATGSRYALSANRLAVRTVPTVMKYRKSGMTSCLKMHPPVSDSLREYYPLLVYKGRAAHKMLTIVARYQQSLE
jgi:hypothetical protein